MCRILIDVEEKCIEIYIERVQAKPSGRIEEDGCILREEIQQEGDNRVVEQLHEQAEGSVEGAGKRESAGEQQEKEEGQGRRKRGVCVR